MVGTGDVLMCSITMLATNTDTGDPILLYQRSAGTQSHCKVVDDQHSLNSDTSASFGRGV